MILLDPFPNFAPVHSTKSDSFLDFGTTIDAQVIVFFYDPIRSMVLVSFLEICFQQKSLVIDRQKRTPFSWHVLLTRNIPLLQASKKKFQKTIPQIV